MAPRIIHVGLGPIGQALLALTTARGWPAAGAVDLDPALTGRDLGSFLDPAVSLGVTVGPLLEPVAADVALVATTSRLESLAPQAEALLRAGRHVVTTCEELSYPWARHETLARRLDGIARDAGKVLIGGGINPGYLMDYLPLVASGLCRSVERIEVERFQDASIRRGPFQRKIGAGLTVAAFDERARGDAPLGHVGLPESVALLADGLGWRLTQIDETLRPVVAAREIVTDELTVATGQVAGLRQIAEGRMGERLCIRLEFVAAVGEPEPRDLIRIAGDPPVELRLTPVHGDLSTAAVVANLIPRIMAGAFQPGLRTMADLAPVGH